MAGLELQGSSFLGLSLRSFRRNQVASMEPGQEDDLHELDQFQINFTDRLLSLLSTTTSDDNSPSSSSSSSSSLSPLLSFSFLSKLLDALVSCQEDFCNLLLLLLDRNPTILVKPPLDRLIPDLLDRSVKALDSLNAVSLSLHALLHFNRQVNIAATAASKNQLPRARRALSKLVDETLSRSRSWGGSGSGRSLSWRNWSSPRSVAEQLGGGIAGGIGIAVCTLSSLIGFAMFVLVTAVPCVGGLPAPVLPPRNLQWSATMVGLQERIAEEWRRNEKKGSGPLLAELQGVEMRAKCLMDCVKEAEEHEPKSEVAATGADLTEACRILEDGMGPFEKKIRTASLRMFSSRAEVVRCLDRTRSIRPALAASAPPPPPLCSDKSWSFRTTHVGN